MVELFASSGDPDQTPRSEASDLGLHCLPVSVYVKEIFNTFKAVKMFFFCSLLKMGLLFVRVQILSL